MQTGTLPTETYWAAAPAEQLASSMRARAELFRKRLDTEGRTAIWRIAERTYYGKDGAGGYSNSVAVTFGGDEGERVQLVENHYRSILQGLLASGGQQRPAFDARALSTDHEAMQQAPLVKGILDGYFRSAHLEQIVIDTARMSLMLAESFTALRWNTSLGRVRGRATRPKYDEDGHETTEMVEQAPAAILDENGAPVAEEDDPGLPPLLVEQTVMEEYDVREGDVDAQTFSPIEVVRDLDAPTSALAWCMLPYRENAWELAAKYPNRRRGILAQRTQPRWPTSALDGDEDRPLEGDDLVTVWYLYHLPTDAMPKGRYAIVCGDEVLFDGPMQLSEIPVYEMVPEREMRSASGFSPTYDLLAMQAAVNEVGDVMLSQHTAVGTQNIVAPKGTDVETKLISRGLGLIEYEPVPGVTNLGAPQALQLLAISEHSYKIKELLIKGMETLSGLNSVARGDPPPQLKSGAALALVQSLVTSFNSNFQGARVMHLERVATGLVKLLQVFAKTKRVAETVGRSQRAALKEWSRDELKGVQRVAVEIGNPILDHASGKLELANMLLQNGALKDPAAIIQVVNTGRIEPTFGGELSARENLLRENDELLDGKPVQVMSLDDHALHVFEHRGVLDNPGVRQNPALVELVMKHIAEHEAAFRALTPTLAMLSRQSVMPPPPPETLGAPLPGGAPNGPPDAAPGGGASSKPPVERAQPLGQAGGSNMPLMPKNPMTNERVPA